MFRLRRYRYYVFFAAIVVLLLYRVAQNSEQWETVSASFPHAALPSKPKLPPIGKSGANNQVDTSFKGISSEDEDLPQRILDNSGKDSPAAKISDLKTTQQADDEEHDADFEHPLKTDTPIKEAGVLAYDHDEAAKAITAPIISVPDKNVGQGAKDAENNPVNPAVTAVHWKKSPSTFQFPRLRLFLSLLVNLKRSQLYNMRSGKSRLRAESCVRHANSRSRRRWSVAGQAIGNMPGAMTS